MSRLDEAVVVLSGVTPTTKNHIVSIGREMAARYQNNQQHSPRPNFSVQLTPTQKQMVEFATKSRT